jgi:hypothetical protein
MSPEPLVASAPGGLAAESRPDARRLCRVLLLAGRAEAGRMARNPLILASVAVVAVAIARGSRGQVPLWWGWDMTIGSWLLIPAGAVLVVAHLAAGRARRDGMSQLYESYPVPEAARAGGLLLGVAGPVALAAAVTAAATAWLDGQGALGAPSPVILLAGLLLVVLAGAVGVALARLLPHPVAGLLAVAVLGVIEVDLVVPEPVPVAFPARVGWLFPWTEPAGLGSLPGPSGLVPAAAHAAELAALAGLAGVAALWPGRRARTASRRGASKAPRRRAGGTAPAAALTLVGVGCLALAGWAAWAQLQPAPPSQLSRLASAITHPAGVERCVARGAVRYCAYPAFVPEIARWAVPVSGVLGRAPALRRTLVVRQVVDDSSWLILTIDGTNNLGASTATPPNAWGRQLARLARAIATFEDAETSDPRLIPGTSVPPVYTDLTWTEGSGLGTSELGLAVSTANWVTGLPTTVPIVSYSNSTGSGSVPVPCVAVGQAREAIALWLAAGATPAARAGFAAALAQGSGPTQVGRKWIATYYLNGSGPAPGPTVTAQGVALAGEMLRLPTAQVRAALSARWPGWLRSQATDAQLAAALRIPLPSVPPVSPPPSGPVPGPNGTVSIIGQNPPSPVCR